MPPAPKPAKQPKGKKRQRVLVRYSADDWRMMFRSDVEGSPEKVYGVGLKYISEHAALVDLIDAVCSKMVVHRDGYQCVLCDSRVQPQNGHVLVRGLYGTRWALDNQFCQCASCNIRHGKAQQAHYYYNWYKAKFGEEHWLNLCARAEEKRDAKSWTVTELRTLLVEYEEMWERLQMMAVHDPASLRRMGYYGEVVPMSPSAPASSGYN